MVVYVDLATNPRGRTIIAALWPMTTLASVFLGLRLYSKLTRSRGLWWDDCFIIAAWMTLLVSCATSTANCRLGFGLHDYQIPLENIVTLGINSLTSGTTSVISVACSKTSFGITLLRLTDGWMKRFIIALLVLLNTTHYFSAVAFWVSCNPPAKTWNPLLPGECWPASATVSYSEFVGACSAFCDFALALLPWRLLLRYDMYNREKIGVAIAMSMGVFAGIICIVKMTTIPLLRDGDFSYNSLPLVCWGFAEPALTIVAASIPMMRHLFKSFRRDAGSGQPTLHLSNASLSIHNSIGGGHSGRAAAARANNNRGGAVSRAGHRINPNSNPNPNPNQDLTQSRDLNQYGASRLEEGRAPGARDDDRSERSILAPAAGSSTATLGVSDGGGSPVSGRGGGIVKMCYEMGSFGKVEDVK